MFADFCVSLSCFHANVQKCDANMVNFFHHPYETKIKIRMTKYTLIKRTSYSIKAEYLKNAFDWSFNWLFMLNHKFLTYWFEVYNANSLICVHLFMSRFYWKVYIKFFWVVAYQVLLKGCKISGCLATDGSNGNFLLTVTANFFFDRKVWHASTIYCRQRFVHLTTNFFFQQSNLKPKSVTICDEFHIFFFHEPN